MRVAVTIIFIVIFAAVAVGLLTVFLSSFGGDKEAGEDGKEIVVQRIQFSLDDGNAFEPVRTASEEATKALPLATPLALVQDPDEPKRWWLPAQNAVFVSEDEGLTWDMARLQDEEPWGGVTALAREPNSETLYLASPVDGRSRIFRSDDLGKTFEEVFSAAQTNAAITALAVDPADPSRVLAGMADGFAVVSKDRGETWTTLSPFPGTIERILFAPTDPSWAFATVTGKGLFHSLNRGEAWDSDRASNINKFRGGRTILDLAIEPGTSTALALATLAGLLSTQDAATFFLVDELLIPPKSLPVLSIAFHPHNRNVAFASARNGLYKTEDYGRTWKVSRFPEGQDIRFVRFDAAVPSRVLIILMPSPKEKKSPTRLF